MDVLSTFELSDKYSVCLSRRNKTVHFGGSLDFFYCTQNMMNSQIFQYVGQFVRDLE